MRLHPQVLQIGTDWGDNSHTKVYLVEGERRAIIDTGVASSPTGDIEPYLRYFGLGLADIDLILNTHGHHDHAGGNLAVQAASSAEVWLHEEDVFMVEDPGRLFDTYNAPVLRLMDRVEKVTEARASFVKTNPPQKVARHLREGDVVDLGRGIQLRVVHLPGHTLGSVGYFWEQEGILFCGDSAMGQGSKSGILPVLYHPLTYSRTLERMGELPIRMLCLGHFYQTLSVSSNPVKKGSEIRQYIRDCQEINNRILEEMGRAMHQHWGEPFPRVLAAALEGLSRRLYLRTDPATGLPPNATNTLAAYYLDLGGRKV